MWPFKRKKAPLPDDTIQYVAPETIFFSQVDITEGMDDHLSLAPDEWIRTDPINTHIPNPTAQGLPAVDAGDDEVYRVAEGMSRLRESMAASADGVYCPICHIATVGLERLRTPCPSCGRELLQFGWT